VIVPVLVALALASPAANVKRATWVPLVRTQGDVPASWRDALQKAAAEDSTRTWVAPPAVSLEEAQLALGCGGWSESCAGQIASMTGAVMALVIEVTAQGVGAVVSVQQVKAGSGAQGPAEKLELAGRTAEDLKWAQELVRGVLKGQKPGFLVVETDVPGAEVWIDGERVGDSPWRGALAPGDHMLSLRQEGKAPLNKPINVRPGQNPAEVISLNAAGTSVAIRPTIGNEPHEVRVTPASPPVAGEMPQKAVVGWSLAGAGGVLALAASVVGGPWVYDLFFNREPCGPDGQQCMPRTVNVYGLLDYSGAERSQFILDAGPVIGASVAAIGVGGLLIGTGAFLATAEEGIEPAAAAGR
jgi:hypothetical protein